MYIYTYTTGLPIRSEKRSRSQAHMGPTSPETYVTLMLTSPGPHVILAWPPVTIARQALEITIPIY